MITPDPERAPFFDGMEGEGTLSARCLGCGKVMRAPLWSWVEAAQWEVSESEAWAAELVPHEFHGEEHFRTAHGMSPYLGALRCECGAVHEVVIGLDEVQPARWRAAVHRVRQIEG